MSEALAAERARAGADDLAAGDLAGAEIHLRDGLRISPTSAELRRTLLVVLARRGRTLEAVPLAADICAEAGGGWLNDLLTAALRAGELELAGRYATILGAVNWGSRYYPDPSAPCAFRTPKRPQEPVLSLPKLRHDVDQFRYLRARGALGGEFEEVIRRYEEVADGLEPLGPEHRASLDEATSARIGEVYNRIVYLRETPRLAQALGDWDGARVERDYLEPPGVVVVDDFLAPEALEELRAFCLESTVWSSVRHAYGRIGSQFQNGFACPLLTQIAEELQARLPDMIGRRYPLRHLWGYKSPPTLAPDATTHADFAAVNVNFWITPDEANLDPATGGLVIYGVDAPAHWTFAMYNARLQELIRPYLQRQQAKAIHVPYRQNRAVIFNSDLFHGSAELRFRPGYENQRINVTMLFGDRENDAHHRGLGGEELSMARPAGWRSAAFRR